MAILQTVMINVCGDYCLLKLNANGQSGLNGY